MSPFHLAAEVFASHTLALAFIGFTFLLKQGASKQRERLSLRDQLELEQWIVRSLTGEEDPMPRFLMRRSVLRPVICRFDQTLKTDPRWHNLRIRLLEAEMLPQARIDATASSWKRRLYSAQSFALAPLVKDEHHILLLVRDEVDSVRACAIEAAMELGAKFGNARAVNVLLTCMSRSEGSVRQMYSQAFAQISETVVAWVGDRLRRDPEVRMQIACLEVLSRADIAEHLPLIFQCCEHKEVSLRLAATRALSASAQPSARRCLLQMTQDEDPKVRMAALEALGSREIGEVTPAFVERLRDSDWWVRLKAALTLREFGEEGRAILAAQEHGNDADAEAIARYALRTYDTNL